MSHTTRPGNSHVLLCLALGAGCGLAVVVLMGFVFFCYFGPGGSDGKPSEPVAAVETPAPGKEKDDKPVAPAPFVGPPRPEQAHIPPQQLEKPPDGPRPKGRPGGKRGDDEVGPPRVEPPPVKPLRKEPPAEEGKWVLLPIDGLPVERMLRQTSDLPHTVRRLKVPEDLRPKQLRLAVTRPVFDDMGGLLRRLGDGYRYTAIGEQQLNSLEKLKKFDVVFLTCAISEGQELRAAPVLRKFVELGGTVYASDLRYGVVLAAFPEYRPASPAPPGAAQTIRADVVDPGLKQYLGKAQIDLRLDASGWAPAAFNPKPGPTPVLAGKYRTMNGNVLPTWLLARFHHKEGTVIFTAFHNAQQNSEVERKLLEYLVFSAVNARVESKLGQVILKTGFSKLDLRPHRLSARAATPAQTYAHKGAGLQVAVGFEALGAKLRVTLTGPDGRKVEHEDATSFLIEIPDAAEGNWRCAVTAVEVPFANFPFVLGIGRAK